MNTVTKRVFGTICILFGLFHTVGYLPGIFGSGYESSGAFAGIAVGLLPVALGVWLWQKPGKR